MLKLPVGTEFFYEFSEKGLYYVDKTPLIHSIFKKHDSPAIVITRPRRFGKSLALSTFRDFLTINADNPNDFSYQEKLFKDTEILKNKEFCQEFMGKYPVIFISLKSVHGEFFDEAYQQLGSVVHKMAFQFNYLSQSKKLSFEEKELFSKLANYDFICNILNRNYLYDALESMTHLLYRHHGIKPILLVDEYDVPVAHAASKKYYEKMISLLKKFLGNVIKSNTYLGKAVLTGCLRVARESIFSGINNLDVYSITNGSDDTIAAGFGFTDEEVGKMLEYYNLQDFKDKVKDQYFGYNSGNAKIYCPWDIVSFCSANLKKAGKDKEVKAEYYWLETSGNAIIDEFLSVMSFEDIERVQTLMSGKPIVVQIRATLSYSDLQRYDASDFWTLLLYAGYLTYNPGYHSSVITEYELYIPNKEIKECFKIKIQDYLQNFPALKTFTSTIVRGLMAGNENVVQKNINKLLSRYIYIGDKPITTPNEDYYMQFLRGIMKVFGTVITEKITSFDTPDGCAEIALRSHDENVVVIMRVKQINNINEDKEEIATKSLIQIINRKYGEYWNSKKDVKAVFAFGICFRNKACAVISERMKRNNNHGSGGSILDLIQWFFSLFGIGKHH